MQGLGPVVGRRRLGRRLCFLALLLIVLPWSAGFAGILDHDAEAHRARFSQSGSEYPDAGRVHLDDSVDAFGHGQRYAAAAAIGGMRERAPSRRGRPEARELGDTHIDPRHDGGALLRTMIAEAIQRKHAGPNRHGGSELRPHILLIAGNLSTDCLTLYRSR